MIFMMITETAKFLYRWFLNKLQGGPLIGQLDKKCVFITGCDSGFGNSLAKKLDSMGVPVYAGCFSEKGATELTQESSTRLKTVQVDVSNTESIAKAYEFVKSSLNSDEEIWGVVNNAGISLGGGPCEFEDRQGFQKIFNVNVFGAAEVCRLFLPSLKKSSGRIVNISSVAGRIGFAEGCLYCSTKFAIEGYSDSLRRDLAPWDVSVHVLEPWFYQTGFLNRELSIAKRTEKWNSQPDHIKEQYGEEWFQNSLKQYVEYVAAVSLPNTHEVIDTYVQALFSKYSKTRYIVGAPSTMVLLKGMLPDFITDKIFCKAKFPVPKALVKD